MFGLVRMWLLGLVSVAVWVGAGLLLRAWADRLPDPRPPAPAVGADPGPPAPQPPPATTALPPPTLWDRLAAWRPAADRTTAYLAGGAALLALAAGGGRALWWLRLRLRSTGDDPRHERSPEARRIARPDGSEIHVEFTGPADGPVVVLTHGWGACATEWYYLRRQLGDRYRLVAWDLPGLGRSRGPANRDFSVDKLAADLRAVVAECGGDRPVLLGHSIGGMITLNFCKLFPTDAARVGGLVLAHTSPTNPLKVTEWRAVAAPLQKPVVEPLAYLMIALAPLLWASNLLSYLNGSLHRSNHKQLFDGTETWGQLEFVSRFVPFVWPATYARGLLGMFRWDATDALPEITVPTLVVAGAADRITLPEASNMIAGRCPAARLVTLTPAGHMGLIERYEEFGRAVGAFVAECRAGGPSVVGVRGPAAPV